MFLRRFVGFLSFQKSASSGQGTKMIGWVMMGPQVSFGNGSSPPSCLRPLSCQKTAVGCFGIYRGGMDTTSDIVRGIMILYCHHKGPYYINPKFHGPCHVYYSWMFCLRAALCAKWRIDSFGAASVVAFFAGRESSPWTAIPRMDCNILFGKFQEAAWLKMSHTNTAHHNFSGII